MSTSDKFILKWHEFQENMMDSVGSLMENNNFADVTLICEDGEEIKAHKIILASSSLFFEKLLARSTHPYSLIYMRGVKSEILLEIINFLYNGEASILQENLMTFLSICDELKVKGLDGYSIGHGNESKHNLPQENMSPRKKIIHT